MSVGRKRVTPVFPIAATACSTRSGGERRVAEVDAGEAVHLQVEEARELDRALRPAPCAPSLALRLARGPARPRRERRDGAGHPRPHDGPPRLVRHGSPPRAPAPPYRSLTTRGTDAPAESIRLTPSSTERSVSITSVDGQHHHVAHVEVVGRDVDGAHLVLAAVLPLQGEGAGQEARRRPPRQPREHEALEGVLRARPADAREDLLGRAVDDADHRHRVEQLLGADEQLLQRARRRTGTRRGRRRPPS